MKRTMNSHANIVNFYMPMLAKLSNDVKLDIIAQLTTTMHTPEVNPNSKLEALKRFSGEWENDKTTTEAAEELRSARYFDDSKNLDW